MIRIYVEEGLGLNKIAEMLGAQVELRLCKFKDTTMRWKERILSDMQKVQKPVQ